MALSTAFTRMFSVQHPIALAPMGGTAGGALAAAVSQGGGLGLIGAAGGNAQWLGRELDLVAGLTDRPWGVGFQSWAAPVSAIQQALERGPQAVMLSFGDPRPFIEPIRKTDAALILQVTDLSEAREALAAGADVIVAQGTEAGGHGGSGGWSTFSFVPVVADLAAPVPVLAAGGIADGRGVAAALALGATGALIGSRFQATAETLADAAITKAIIEGSGEDTVRGTILDVIRGSRWPSRYPARTLRNRFTEQWRGREAELAADSEARQEYRDAVAHGELPPQPVWTSQAIDLITDLRPAAELVGAIGDEAAGILARLSPR
ncbi:MAG TPA: nitronate monooxygenase [Streptosporangiaceae bacterium]|jgi:nitronate monooxygenase